jgi:3-phenylpropionate/trans-cinnamate dioxygenase ferredoxin reductase subunit
LQHGVVIVGAGYAGGECAIRLRQVGYTGPITLVGAEAHAPYHRPPLSKAYLAGEADALTLPVRPEAAYETAGIRFIAGTLVEALDRPARVARLSSGEPLQYDWLVLATGGRPRTLQCPGAGTAGIHYLRTRDDTEALWPKLKPGRRLLIIGGGYIGLEAAAIAIKRGLAVTVLEAAPRLLARVAGEEISAFYEHAHRQAGVTIITRARLSRFEPDPSGLAGAAVLEDGSRIAADVILAGIGLLPAVELAESAGLSVNDGIVVDAECRTADPAILAIGDCANYPSPFLGCRVRLESVPNAQEMARVAAATIIGAPVAYAGVPWFWSDQYDLKLQAAGLSRGHDQAVLRGDTSAKAFIVFYLQNGTLIAADAVNRPGEFMVAKRLVERKASIPASALADLGVPLKSLMS